MLYFYLRSFLWDLIDFKMCFTCHLALRPGDTAICSEDIDKNALWHPGCFSCSVCNELLVDLTYFTKNNEIFCEKHYQEQIKTCSSCNKVTQNYFESFPKVGFEILSFYFKVINSPEYISAEDKYYHLEHFRCCNCTLSLSNEKYLTFEDNVYCFRCHELLFPKVSFETK